MGKEPHLGNARVLFSDKDNNGLIEDSEISEISSFYPFGMRHKGGGLRVNESCDYLYNGKELDTDFGLNWYHYGARMYDPAIGRFTGVDPISDKFAHLSTFNYASNNPISNIDLWGLQGVSVVDRRNNSLSDGRTAQVPVITPSGGSTQTVIGVEGTPQVQNTKVTGVSEFTSDVIDIATTSINLALGVVGAEAMVADDVAKGIGFVDDAVRALSAPQGLSKGQFSKMSSMIRGGAGKFGDDIVVQGSRAKGTARATSDIDIGIRVAGDKFDDIIKSRFGTPNAGSAKERTMLHAIKTGKIQRGELGLSKLGKQVESEIGMKVDLSVIRKGGAFDNGPFIPLKN